MSTRLVSLLATLVLAGTIAAQGSPGTSGTSGGSNSTGTSGSSGSKSNGSSGSQSGSSGTSGTSGGSHSTGTSGSSGSQSNGSSGMKSGSSGTSGSSGNGSAGTSGSSGSCSNGSPGTSGTSGGTKSSGTSGSSGSKSNGSSGMKSGSSGTSGSSGMGSAGTSGSSGSGTSGTSGSSGMGSAGTSGSSGKGSSGTSGSSGSNGSHSPGTSGSSGSSTSAGTSGSSGSGSPGTSGTSQSSSTGGDPKDPYLRTITNRCFTITDCGLAGKVTKVMFGNTMLSRTGKFGAGSYRFKGSHTLIVCPPLCLPEGRYLISYGDSNGPIGSKWVRMLDPKHPTLVCEREHQTGFRQCLFTHNGKKTATSHYLVVSPFKEPSVLPGVIRLGVGRNFSKLYCFHQPGICVRWEFPVIPAVAIGFTGHFQAAFPDASNPVLPFPVSNVCSTTYK